MHLHAISCCKIKCFLLQVCHSNDVSKRNPQICSTLPAFIDDEITQRAKLRDVSKSEFASKIIQKWFADGCPPVDDVEKALGAGNPTTPPKVRVS